MHWRWLALVALTSCGDGGSGDGFADVVCLCVDAAGSGGGTKGFCEPVTQSGCRQAWEKCAQIVEGLDPFVARTACVPRGTKRAGEICEAGEPGPMGYDDCEAGLACHGGVCVGICALGPPADKTNCQVPDDESCFSVPGMFEVFGSDNIGLCAPSCDPVTQKRQSGGELTADDCPADGERIGACYLAPARGSAGCLWIPDSTPDTEPYEPLSRSTHGQDETCIGPSPTECFTGGCAAGYGPVLEDPGSPRNRCAAWCRPLPVFLGADETYNLYASWDVAGAGETARLANAAKGDLASGHGCSTDKTAAEGGNETASMIHDCRYLSGLVENDDISAAVGACAPLDTSIDYGDCKNWDLGAWMRGTYAMRPNGTPNPEYDPYYCTGGIFGGAIDRSRCPIGCIGPDELETIYQSFPFAGD